MLAYLLRNDAKNKPLMQTSTGKVKRPGKPCGKTHISAAYKCGRHFTNGKLNDEGKAARAEFLAKVKAAKAGKTDGGYKEFQKVAIAKHGKLLNEIDSHVVPKAIWQRRNELREAVKTDPSLKPELRKIQKLNDAEFDKAMAARVVGMEKLRDSLMASGDEKAAKRWASTVTIDKTATEFVKGVTKTSLKRDLAEVHQLTGGQTSGIKLVANVSDIPMASNVSKRLNLGFQMTPKQRREAFFHENGHFVEFSNPAIAAAAREFRSSRATSKPVPYRDLQPDTNLSASVMAVRGKFFDPYVGTIYKSGFTEVISMGVERFSTPENMAQFFSEDREHFEFTLGVLESNRAKKKK